MRRNAAENPEDYEEPSGAIPRHRTAIRRGSQSRPVALAQAHGLIGQETSFFDYGCGWGEDITLLKTSGINAEGWDPYYRPAARIESAECVNLGYVLNVIENPQERQETLLSAFGLASKVLIVSVRVDQSLSGATEFSDGVVTNSGSFQKIYTQSEFREYIQTVLGRKPYMAGLGVAYVFKSESAESAHLAQLSITPIKRERTRIFDQFAADAEGRALVDATRMLGRFPLASEFEHYPVLQLRFGSKTRIERVVNALLNPQTLEETKELKRSDILTYFAMLFLRGIRPPRFRLLPPETQADIKLLWPSYRRAMDEGREFLFSLAQPEAIKKACASAPVGKRLPEAFYLHRSAEDTLPALLKVLLFAARQVVGDVEYNIAKISLDGRKVSFQNYKNFDENPHPELLNSVRVHLPTASFAIRDYAASENPPILHRKETFLDPLYTDYFAFAELTRQEEELALLSRSDIGFRQQWEALLRERAFCIKGHSVVKESDR